MRKKKNVHVNTRMISILKLHEERMNEMSQKDKHIKEINVKINKANETIVSLKKDEALLKINDLSSNGILKMMDIKAEIFKLDSCIKNWNEEKKYISSGTKDMEYIMSSCNLIDEYINCENNENILLKDADNMNINEDTHKKLNEIGDRKRDIIDEYMKVIDPSYSSYRKLYNSSDSYCKNCNIDLYISDSFGSCPNCGLCNTNILQEAETLSWQQTQEMDFRPQFTYDRVSHLDDWLKRFTAKEQKEIPDEIIKLVIKEAEKEKIKNLLDLDEARVKKYLKKLELKNYYDNVISIINRINKRPAFILTQEIEDKIKYMFNKIQEPFEKYKGNNRKSMLSYSYLLNKFFLILDLPEFSRYFFLLKSADKLRVQDEIFKKIVDELAVTDKSTHWSFFPSL
jgi:hypothetical protein